MQKVIAKIHLGNIRRNAEKFKRLTATRLYAVVKADAYGHGAEEVVNALSGVADGFAVALLDEAMAIDVAACGKDILIFTPPLCTQEVRAATDRGFILTVPDLWTARLVAKTCVSERRIARVHLKVNTGMNRYGMNASMLGKVCKLFQGCPFVHVEGLYSHLYGSAVASANEQRRLFLQMQAVCRRYFPNVISHLSATHGALLGKAFAFDAVRVGLGLYGYLPDGDNGLTLEKGMHVYAKTVTSRKYSFGGVGYGEAKSLPQGRFGVLRVGYADGYLRNKDNGTDGYEGNLNHFCMDVCLRSGEKRRGQEVPVMTDAARTAKRTGTIAYEVLCAATRRAERRYDNE